MKKILASTMALLMTAAICTSCGDDSSSDAAATTTTPAATTTPAETTTTAPPETTVPEETTAAEGEGEGEENEALKDISEIPDSLMYAENPSLAFTADMDISFAEMFNEEKDGKFPGDADYAGDESVLELSVEEIGGVEMLKVAALKTDAGLINHVKLRLDMNKLFAGQEEDMEKIFTVKADFIIVAEDEWESDTGEMFLVPGWVGGAFGTNNDDEWNGNLIEWGATGVMNQEYTSVWVPVDTTIRPGVKGGKAQFSKDFETNFLTIMQWGRTHDTTLYIADLVFEDEEGNQIMCNYGK